MTSSQVVETPVTNNSSFQNYPHPGDHNIRTNLSWVQLPLGTGKFFFRLFRQKNASPLFWTYFVALIWQAGCPKLKELFVANLLLHSTPISTEVVRKAIIFNEQRSLDGVFCPVVKHAGSGRARNRAGNTRRSRVFLPAFARLRICLFRQSN